MTPKTGWSPEEAPEGTTSAEPPLPPNNSGSTVELLTRLVSDGQDYATTEIARQKVRAGIIGKAVRDATILIVAALFLLMGTLVALVVGGIWALAPYTGPLAATAIVLLLCFGLIITLALIARARVKSALRRIISPKEEG